jgi:hypothetical protein
MTILEAEETLLPPKCIAEPWRSRIGRPKESGDVEVAFAPFGAAQGKKEGVHNVHTLGFGSGRVMSRDMGDSSVSGHR